LQILRCSVTRDANEQDKSNLAERFREVFGAIVVMFDLLPIDALSRFTGLDKDDIKAALRLRSVVDIGDEKESLIRLFHPSFRDFLLGKQRCQDEHFWINGHQTHRNLSKCCLELMVDNLERDIYSLKIPAALTVQVDSSIMEVPLSCLS
jgi:hypothetical protein